MRKTFLVLGVLLLAAAQAASQTTETTPIPRGAGADSEIAAAKKYRESQNANSTDSNPTSSNETKSQRSKRAVMPTSVDYSSLIGPVQNRGSCKGSDMAFAFVDLLNYWSAKNGTYKKYSAQQMIDCVQENFGCGGGNTIWPIFMYGLNKGIVEESAYPFSGAAKACQAKTSSYYLNDFCYYEPKGDENILKLLVSRYGPIASASHTTPAFYSYKSGVHLDATCSKAYDFADETIVIVGFGTDATGGDYWLARTSIGPAFGMGGYIKLARNRGNHCGIANFVIAPCPR